MTVGDIGDAESPAECEPAAGTGGVANTGDEARDGAREGPREGPPRAEASASGEKAAVKRGATGARSIGDGDNVEITERSDVRSKGLVTADPAGREGPGDGIRRVRPEETGRERTAGEAEGREREGPGAGSAEARRERSAVARREYVGGDRGAGDIGRREGRGRDRRRRFEIQRSEFKKKCRTSPIRGVRTRALDHTMN